MFDEEKAKKSQDKVSKEIDDKGEKADKISRQAERAAEKAAKAAKKAAEEAEKAERLKKKAEKAKDAVDNADEKLNKLKKRHAKMLEKQKIAESAARDNSSNFAVVILLILLCVIICLGIAIFNIIKSKNTDYDVQPDFLANEKQLSQSEVEGAISEIDSIIEDYKKSMVLGVQTSEEITSYYVYDVNGNCFMNSYNYDNTVRIMYNETRKAAVANLDTGEIWVDIETDPLDLMKSAIEVYESNKEGCYFSEVDSEEIPEVKEYRVTITGLSNIKQVYNNFEDGLGDLRFYSEEALKEKDLKAELIFGVQLATSLSVEFSPVFYCNMFSESGEIRTSYVAASYGKIEDIEIPVDFIKEANDIDDVDIDAFTEAFNTTSAIVSEKLIDLGIINAVEVEE